MAETEWKNHVNSMNMQKRDTKSRKQIETNPEISRK